MLCNITNCGNDATDYIAINIPNTPTENYDAVNPVRVDICAYHRRLIHGQALDGLSIRPAPSKETHG